MTKNIIILGGGESGTGAAILCRKLGYDVLLSDAGAIPEKYKKELLAFDIPFEEGGHSVERMLAADEVVKSPGIPETNELVKQIRAKGIGIISEIELAYRHKGDSRIIAITGSNGKTTTTTLTWEICKAGGLDCALVGNVGVSFARQVALDPKPLYVAEISSFQLDDIVDFRPDVAVLLNITEDHLDRYDYQFSKYVASKFNIIKNQSKNDIFIYCADDPVITAYIKDKNLLPNLLPFTMHYQLPEGAYMMNNIMSIQTDDQSMEMNVNDFAVKGKHNQYNAMAAGLASSSVGIRKQKIREAVEVFQTLEHRMEKVLTVRGVAFINDSKATNVNSTWFALESMTDPVILILGGVDKGNDYTALLELVKEKVKAIVCMGVDNRKIHEAFGNVVEVIVDTAGAKEAVEASFKLAEKGDVVLLSPACASFDLFKNYEDRGRQFKEAVKEL